MVYDDGAVLNASALQKGFLFLVTRHCESKSMQKEALKTSILKKFCRNPLENLRMVCFNQNSYF